MEKCARVLVDGSSDLEFDYAIPADLLAKVAVGSRVRIPLRARSATGTVISIETPSIELADKLRPIDGLIDEFPVLTETLLKLGRWIGSYYCAPLESVMRSMLPEAVRSERHGFQSRKKVYLGKEAPEDAEALAKRAPRQAEVLEMLADSPEGIPLSDLPAAAVKSLLGKGWVEVKDEVVGRDPNADEQFIPSSSLELTAEQAVAFEEIVKATDSTEGSKPILLHGVTGSGKTEVYLQAIEKVIEEGKTVIVLVPEIALTPQTVNRFRSRFSHMVDKIAVLHSHLSKGERHDEWHKIHRRQARIVIGARSAIFAPLENLGLIVVDEEHEGSYKQDSAPRYHGRDVAVVRGSMEKCPVVLGSATPSLESFQNATIGKYQLVELTQRVDDCSLPLMRIVDMKLEGKKREKGGGPSIFSEKLRIAIDARLEKGEQVILFLNRRGFATSLLCQNCGHVAECPHCSVSLTFHRTEERLVCHICGFQKVAPRRCPECRDPAIRLAGYGTERVEQSLKDTFPKARSVRVDADSMSRKNQLRDTFRAFKAQKIDIMVGTQMIAKGLHFPNITLVGILNADLGLHIPDFRAAERTFQLLVQVAGRAGRGETRGEVMVQTFTPHSPAIQFSRQHDFAGYADQELEMRKMCSFPPFGRVVLITVRSTHERLAEFSLETIHKRLKAALTGEVVMGEPVASPLVKAAGQFRFQLMLRAKLARQMTEPLQAVLAALTFPDEVFVAVDVDPINLS